jgi:hypothetical protein
MARKRTGPAKVVKVVSAVEIAANPGKYRISGKVARPVAAETRTKGILGGPVDDMVYVVSDSEVASGKYKVEGGPAQVVIDSDLVPSRKTGDTKNVVPVYVVAGSLGQQSYEEKVLSYSPIAYWPLNETSGTTADNAEGTAARDGTYARNVTTMTTGTGIGDGNTAPLFDGVNDYCDIYSDSLRDAFDGTGETEGTLSAWIKASGAGVWTDGTNRATINLQANTSNVVRFTRGTVNNRINLTYVASGVNTEVQDDSVKTTAWYHFALTWSLTADEVKAYTNGAQIGSTQAGLGTWGAGANLADTDTVIGADDTDGGPTGPWDGYLAHVAIWTTPLSAGDITALATV